MFKVIAKNIYVPRRNSINVTLDIFCDGAPFELGADDKIIFTVRKSLNEPVLLQKEADDRHIILDETDTDLTEGTYFYDVTILSAGEVITAIPPHKFCILGVVYDGKKANL